MNGLYSRQLDKHEGSKEAVDVKIREGQVFKVIHQLSTRTTPALSVFFSTAPPPPLSIFDVYAPLLFLSLSIFIFIYFYVVILFDFYKI